jgi:hypothetical protein
MVALRSGNCERCGKAFDKKWPYHPQRFCSGSCKTRFRRETGADDVTKTCKGCGLRFDSDRHRKQVYCCVACVPKFKPGRRIRSG